MRAPESRAALCGDRAFIERAERMCVRMGLSVAVRFTSSVELWEWARSGTGEATTVLLGPCSVGPGALNTAGFLSASTPELTVLLSSECETSDHLPSAVRVIDIDDPTETESSGVSCPGAAPDRGSVLTVAGARGGVGKTAVAVACALLASRAGLSTALVDLDLQFGDVDFVFDRVARRTLVDAAAALESGAADLRPVAERAAPGLDLFLPPHDPEFADVVAPAVGSIVRALRGAYDLTVVDTGAQWSGVNVEAMEEADVVALVMDARVSSVRSQVRARALCSRLGIPDARLMHVMNRVSDASEAHPMDAAAALCIPEVWALSDGAREVSDLMGVGRPEGLLDGPNVFVSSVADLLSAALGRVGVEFALAQGRQHRTRRKRRW